MLLVIAALALGLAGGIALIANELRRSPEGYEDDHGFHPVADAPKKRMPTSSSKRAKPVAPQPNRQTAPQALALR